MGCSQSKTTTDDVVERVSVDTSAVEAPANVDVSAPEVVIEEPSQSTEELPSTVRASAPVDDVEEAPTTEEPAAALVEGEAENVVESATGPAEEKVEKVVESAAVPVEGEVETPAESAPEHVEEVVEVAPFIETPVLKIDAPVEEVAKPPASVEEVAELSAPVEEIAEAPALVEEAVETPAPVQEGSYAEPSAPVEEVAEPPAFVEVVAEAPAPVEEVAEIPAFVETVAETSAPVDEEAPKSEENRSEEKVEALTLQSEPLVEGNEPKSEAAVEASVEEEDDSKSEVVAVTPEIETKAAESSLIFKAENVTFNDKGVAFYNFDGVDLSNPVNDVHISKRYSDFKALHAQLTGKDGKVTDLPALPTASFLQGRNNKKMLEDRKTQFTILLNAIAANPLALHSDMFKAFLA